MYACFFASVLTESDGVFLALRGIPQNEAECWLYGTPLRYGRLIVDGFLNDWCLVLLVRKSGRKGVDECLKLRDKMVRNLEECHQHCC